MKKNRLYLGKILYGIIFIVFVPVLLIFWAVNIDAFKNYSLPDYSFFGLSIALLGLIAIIRGMTDLIILGKGLPMNIYPPKFLVTRGIYRWFSHPIYIGAGLVSIGLFLFFRSATGLFVVTPIFILAMISLVNGYEGPKMKKLFGKNLSKYKPILSMSEFIAKNKFTYFLWSPFKNFAEKIANYRQDRIFFNGRFRIISHSLYSGLAGAIGVSIFAYVTRNNLAAILFLTFIILGAALFAQVRWGNYALLRPFGYWGGILGGIIGAIIINIVFNIPLYHILLAGVLLAPFSQAMGRFRCLSQGCCHGILTNKNLGIRIWQKQSRAVVLSGLKGKYIHATQLYSIIFNLILGFFLFALWMSGKFNTSVIVGLYLILTGIERFAEDSCRGEKQTKMAGELMENQWIAICAFLIGIIITMVHFPYVKVPNFNLNLSFIIAFFLGALITAFSMSMDFPKSKIRFSRLSG